MRVKDIAMQALHHSTLLQNAAVKVRFPIERKLFRGTHVSNSTHASVIHFSVNRSATQYTKRILCRLARDNNMTPVHLNEFAFSNDMPFFDRMSAQQMAEYQHVFKPTGYVYSAFGGYVHGIPDLDRFLILLVIRDPRDALTSRYYSKAFSHRLPDNSKKAAHFLEIREQVRRMSVDEFVLSEMNSYCERYRVYMKHLVNLDNVLVTKYEDLTSDFPTWLDSVLSFFSLSCKDSTREALISEATDTEDMKENKMHHKRQVTPGDHRRKLKPETIARLNTELSDILSDYGYT